MNHPNQLVSLYMAWSDASRILDVYLTGEYAEAGAAFDAALAQRQSIPEPTWFTDADPVVALTPAWQASVRKWRQLRDDERMAWHAYQTAKSAQAQDVLIRAAQDTALTRDLVKAAQADGYTIDTVPGYQAGVRNKLGVIFISHDGHQLKNVVWDQGSHRNPSAGRYRVGSRHHHAIIEALGFIRERSPAVFVGY